MDYRFKYLIFYAVVLFMLFVAALLVTGVGEIISTKSFKIAFDLPNIHLVFIAIVVFSFAISFIYIPFYAKPAQENFAFVNEKQKQQILEQIDGVIKNETKNRSVQNRNNIEYAQNTVIYSTGNRVLDWVYQPILISIDNNVIRIDASIYFIQKLKKALNM